MKPWIFIAATLLVTSALAHDAPVDETSCHDNKAESVRHCHYKDRVSNKLDTSYDYTPIPIFDRDAWGFITYVPSTTVGYYTGQMCRVSVDHVVALKDAYLSGGVHWSTAKKRQFANDRSNHVPACLSINSSKGASTPKHFLRKSKDGKGLDYTFADWCGYLKTYHQVKTKWELSFANNDIDLFAKCGIKVKGAYLNYGKH